MDHQPYAEEAPLDEKIVAALERVARALRGLLWEAVQPLGLSPIQGQLLLYLKDHREENCRVSYLAREFGLTQATVSDAVSSLQDKGLVRRRPSYKDRRVSTLSLTPSGHALAARLAHWDRRAGRALQAFSRAEREQALFFLMGLIDGWQRLGIVSVARMCVTCRFFQRDATPNTGAPYYCRLLERPLTVSALRLDCADHEPAVAAAASP